MTARVDTHYCLARFVLEAVTPLSIASGQGDGLLDAALVRDANGLPMIPGPSLAGVLSSLHRRLNPNPDAGLTSPTERLFGFQDKDNGASSRVTVSHGVLIDASGQAVEGLLLGQARRRLQSDPLLRRAASVDAAVVRDRVRIAARGAAADQGLFDRTILPAGYRFAAEISLWTNADGAARAWPELLSLLRHPLFRLGGSTRAGLGAMQLVRLHERVFALGLDDGGGRRDVDDYARLGSSVADVAGLNPATPAPAADDPQLAVARITLKPRHFWCIAGTGEPLGASSSKAPDRTPKREPRVGWKESKGRIDEGKDAPVLVPAASIKGVLAHRTVFHAHRLAQRWADGKVWDIDPRQASAEARALFGDIADTGERRGQAGRIFIDDVLLDPKQLKSETLTHNAIDRFSGGVRNRLLFSEQVLVKGEIRLQLRLDLRGLAPDDAALPALQAALRDLVTGRLPIGGRTSTGHGTMQGRVEWQVPDAWRQVLQTLEGNA